MPLTDYIESTETVLQLTANRLQEFSDWHVSIFSGTSMQRLYHQLSAAQLPAAIVIYQGGRRRQHPRRTLTLQVLIATAHGEAEQGAASGRQLLDEAMARLDDFRYNDALWQYQADLPLDLDGANTCYLLTFDILLP